MKDEESSLRYRPHKPSPHSPRPSLTSRTSASAQFIIWQDEETALYGQRPTSSHLTLAPSSQHRGSGANIMSQRDKNIPVKPLMPTLAQKRNIKSPITPRLATTATPPALAKHGPTRGATTPGNTVRSPAGTKDQLATPAKAFVNINNNITPRSGSRKSRVDSNQSTPTSTPNGSFSHIDAVSSGGKHTSFAGVGLGIGSQGNKSRPTSMVGMPEGALSPGSTLESRFRRPGSDGDGSMFFHASDVPRSSSPESRPALRSMPSATKSSFLHANGQIDESLRPAAQSSPPLSSISTWSKKSQFFRADGCADGDVPPIPSLPSPSAMHAPPQFFQAAPAFRPVSPEKEPQNFHLSYRKGASQIIRPPTERPKHISILPPNGSASSLDLRRRSLVRSPEQTGRDPHKRTSSLSSIESGASARRTSGAGFDAAGLSPLQAILQSPSDPSSSTSNVPSWPQISSPVLERGMFGNESTVATRERKVSPSSPVFSIAPQSPTKSQSSFSNQMIESIMNARVERKIQDLEISNSSLMAINKSLEKEVRRQNKELRRFRRLSRAGQLSTVSSLLSVGTANEDGASGGDLNALEELSEEGEQEEEEEEEEPGESSDDSSESDLALLSPEAIAEREERKLAKDSKRLQLDLAKHRDILVDSQKLNQSLRRCMAWTDMMITDGKKALEYKAETEIGGRILDHDELNEHHGEGEFGDEEGQRHSLLGSWSPSPNPMPHLEALDGLLGLDTSAITNPQAATVGATPRVPSEALRKADFWGIANAL